MQYLTYIAIVLFLGGSLYRLFQYIQSPRRFPILLMPAPKNRMIVLFHVLGDLFILRRLFRSNIILWIGSWVFHWGWVFLVLSHLRFFWKSSSPPLWIINLQIYEREITFLWILSIVYLLVLRIVSTRVRYISTVEDYGVLLLFLGIACTGLFLKYRDPVNILLVQDFIRGLWNFSNQPFPDHGMFRLHFIFNLILFIYFPFGKLIHSFGAFLSPTLYSVDKGYKN